MGGVVADKLRVAVLISGRGSNLQALLDACVAPDFPAEIRLVISNVAGVYGLERAAAAGVATRIIDHRGFASRPAFDAALDAALRDVDAELVCLAGFMRLLTPWFAEQWRDRLINIHPALLPSFKGLHTHRRALETGVKLHGCTVHFVTPELDDGPIIVQAAVPVLPNDDEDSLAARERRVTIDGRVVRLRDAATPLPTLINPAN
jgi:phosphoribosylglycinamide formyltransferase-1